MKYLILYVSIVMASGLLMTNIYNSIVDAKSWGANIPQSINTAREYYKFVNPGNFFRIFSPVNQLLGLLVVVLFWKTSPSIRLYLGIAFILYILGDVLTFAFFYPRNEIMLKTAQLTDIGILRKAWTEWTNINWVRSLIILIGLAFSFLSLHRIFLLKTLVPV